MKEIKAKNLKSGDVIIVRFYNHDKNKIAGKRLQHFDYTRHLLTIIAIDIKLIGSESYVYIRSVEFDVKISSGDEEYHCFC